MSVLNGLVHLPPPPPQTLTTEQQIEAFQTAYPDMPKDEIVAFVNFYQGVMQLDTSKLNFDTVTPNDPQLNSPKGLSGTAGTENTSGTSGNFKENPWLSANPFATFFTIFLELQAELTKIKVAEGMMEGQIMMDSLSMAKDLAKVVKDLKKEEMLMNIASAITSGLGAVFSIVISTAGFANKGPNGEFNQGYSLFGQGTQSAVNMAEKTLHAIINAKQAELEFTKTIMESCLRLLQDRGISTHTEAQKTADEMISQLLQKLDKIIDEEMRAHGFQVH